jgi:hypothetical protein
MKLASKLLNALSENRKRYIAKVFDRNGDFIFSKAEKSGGAWLIGGDYPRDQTNNKIFIYSLDDLKVYYLKGRILKLQDKISDGEIAELERVYADMHS